MTHTHGPRPLTSAPALSAARRRVLQAVLDLQQGHQVVTINHVAAHLGGHANSARQHLDALADLKLLTVTDVPSGRPGRRPRGYTLTTLGRHSLGRVDESRELAEVFASYLVASGSGPEQAQDIGRSWGTRRADELGAARDRSALEAVVEVLDILGFDPSTMQTEQGDAVILRTCPLLDMAHGSPEFICNIHRGLVDGVLRRIGAREGVELTPFSDPDGCRLNLTPPPKGASRRAS